MRERPAVLRRAASRFGALVATLLAAAACGGDDPAATTTSTPSATAGVATTATAPKIAPPTTVTRPVTTPAAVATDPPATQTPATLPTTSVPSVPLSGATVEVTSALMTNPFVLERVGEFGGLVVYDGESVDGDFALRCVAVGHDGDTTWTEWCALPGDSASFVVVDGIDPWVANVGAEHLDVSLTKYPPTWAVTTSGCTEPMVALIGAADLVGAVAPTGVACAGDAAVLTYGGVYMQPGSGDGGGVVLFGGDEGWNPVASGTSIDCTDLSDVPDACALFGVDSELLDATSPIPAPALIAPQADLIALRDVTEDVRAMAAQPSDSETDDVDVDAVVESIEAALVQPDAEVTPTVGRHDEVSFNRYTLLVVDVPALDDSIRSTTWAVWITTATPEQPSMVHRAYAWENCARGVAEGDLCV